MAFTASAVMEMRSSGASNLNSGVFDSGVANPGTDYTLQDSSQANGTDLASSNGTNANPSVTSAGYSFTSSDEGNSIVISAGTNWTVSVYIITDTSGGAAILDKACGSAASISSGTWRMGGAYPGGNSTAGISDDARFELFTGGNTVWIKNGSYSLNQITISSTATTVTNMLKVMGYNSSRGDDPTGSNRPVISMGANTFNFSAAICMLSNLSLTGTGTSTLLPGSDCFVYNVKVINTSSTANRNAFALGNNGPSVYNSEAMSLNGSAIAVVGTPTIHGCYVHDSDLGISGSGANGNYGFNIIENCKTAGLQMTGVTQRATFHNSTVYGSEAKIGIGLNLTGATASNLKIYNNIFYGLATGIAFVAAQDSVVEDYNNFYNVTTARTNASTGEHSITLDPSFSSVSQITGSNGSTSSTTLTDGAADFSAVVDNVDTVYVTSNTGGNTGNFLITGHTTTTLTVNNSLGTGSSTVYSVNIGHNFAVGTNMKAVGFPGAFQAGYSTGYLDLGSVQRQEQASGGASGFLIF